MTVMERLANSIVVPVVVLDKVEDAIPTAKAMAAGGVDTMEITFRTACAPDAIRAVAENCPDVLVGAGTEGDFHGVDAAGSHSVSQRNGILNLLQNNNGNNDGLCKSFHYSHSKWSP